jgi:L-2-hydroxyglutarate oxidase LhgO
LKARLCVEGRRMLYDFLEARHVAFDKCGKFVVATRDDEVEHVEAILQQGLTNGVEGLVKITRAQALAAEPQLNCQMALVSPESGVFDSHGYMLALEGEIEAAGGSVVVATPFEGATPLDGGGFKVRAGGAEPAAFTCRLLVTAPGLEAQHVAAEIEGFPARAIPEAHFGKGNYFRLTGKAPFARLIYPPPIPGALGTHYRRDLGGQAVFGPDLHYVDEPEYDVDVEAAPDFYSYIRKFWPGLPDGALAPDYVGVRPKLHGPGEPQPDFQIENAEVHGLPGLVALFGIESPGLTSSLAIGEEVAAKLGL